MTDKTEVEALAVRAVSDNGKRWRIVPEDGDWEMVVVGHATAGQAKVICERIEAALNPPPPAGDTGEAVAWAYVNRDGECEQIEWGPVFDDPDVTPLYAHPSDAAEIPALRDKLAAVESAMGKDAVRFMFPPDGGDPTLAEMVANMRQQLDAAEAQLATAEESLAEARMSAQNWETVQRATQTRLLEAETERAGLISRCEALETLWRNVAKDLSRAEQYRTNLTESPHETLRLLLACFPDTEEYDDHRRRVAEFCGLLIAERDEADAEITLTESLLADERASALAAEAESDRLRRALEDATKLADGYGIVLAMISAGADAPQKFAKRMLAEYASEAEAVRNFK